MVINYNYIQILIREMLLKTELYDFGKYSLANGGLY